MLKTITLASAAMALALSTAPSFAKELKSIGVSLGSMGNPFFVALSKGAEFEAKKTNPNVKITTVGFEYDLGKQVTQIDNFIAAGVDLILLNPGDPKAIGPAIKKAQAAGIVVVAVDTAAEGADATVTTNNVQAGEISCQYIVDKLGAKGDVIIENGPQVSAVIDRVTGCKNVLSKNPGIKVLSSDQDAKGSREGGLTVAQGYLTRFPKIDAIFAINDPQAIGTDLAARQQNRTGMIITAVDGAPDIEAALKDPAAAQIQASASQDPFFMARRAMQIGVGILNGQKPASTVELLPSKLVTRDNVAEYKGWTSDRSRSHHRRDRTGRRLSRRISAFAGYMVHGIKRRSSSFNTERIDHLYQDPHDGNVQFLMHYGDLTDTSNLIRIVRRYSRRDLQSRRAEPRRGQLREPGIYRQCRRHRRAAASRGDPHPRHGEETRSTRPRPRNSTAWSRRSRRGRRRPSIRARPMGSPSSTATGSP